MRSPEARPLRTTAELWQVHPKGTRSGREAGVLNRSAGPVRTEIAAWDAGRPAPTTTDKLVASRPAPRCSTSAQPTNLAPIGRGAMAHAQSLTLSSPAGARER